MVAQRRRSLLVRFAALAFVALLIAGCRIEVPINARDSGPGQTVPQSEEPVPAPSELAADGGTELPPLPRAEIVGNDMTFDRGGYIEPSDRVAFSDGVSRTPGWSQKSELINGESVYVSEAGCTASLRDTASQGPLVVPGDDRASTEALFRFMDPTILPDYLVTTSWLWGPSPGESSASVEFLTYVREAAGETPASAVSLRLFHATGTALAFAVSCPSDDGLEEAVSDIRSHLSVIPPG